MANRPSNTPFICKLVCLSVCLVAPIAQAASSQGVLLVVNSKSPESLAVANHYITLRNIPPCNVVYLDHVLATPADGGESISSSRFRTDILVPVTKQMDERGIRAQIDCITYSAGFPTRVLVQPEQQKYLAYRFKKYNIHFHAPFASLTSATFFPS